MEPLARITTSSRTLPGLTGIVSAICESIAVQVRDHSPLVDLDELLCISSAAFRLYVFDPRLNPDQDGIRLFSDTSPYFSNYGPYESLSYYLGWEIQEINTIPDAVFWKLIRFEIEAGRPLVAMAPKPPFHPRLIRQYRGRFPDGEVGFQDTTQSSTEWIPFEGLTQRSPDPEIFRNWCVIVRPSRSPEWAATKDRQRIDLLRWALKHGQNKREFFHETRENYASGLQGYTCFAANLDKLRASLDRLDADDHSSSDAPDWILPWQPSNSDTSRPIAEQYHHAHAYLVDRITELHRGRHAAGRVLQAWSRASLAPQSTAPQPSAHAQPRALLQVDPMRAYLADAAKAYTQVAATLQPWLMSQLEPNASLDLETLKQRLTQLSSLLRECAGHEQTALVNLKKGLSNF